MFLSKLRACRPRQCTSDCAPSRIARMFSGFSCLSEGDSYKLSQQSSHWLSPDISYVSSGFLYVDVSIRIWTHGLTHERPEDIVVRCACMYVLQGGFREVAFHLFHRSHRCAVCACMYVLQGVFREVAFHLFHRKPSLRGVCMHVCATRGFQGSGFPLVSQEAIVARCLHACMCYKGFSGKWLSTCFTGSHRCAAFACMYLLQGVFREVAFHLFHRKPSLRGVCMHVCATRGFHGSGFPLVSPETIGRMCSHACTWYEGFSRKFLYLFYLSTPS